MMNMSINLDRLRDIGKSATKMSSDQISESLSRNKDKVYGAMGSIASMAGSIVSSRASMVSNMMEKPSEVLNSMAIDKDNTYGKYQIPILKFSASNIIQNVGQSMLQKVNPNSEKEEDEKDTNQVQRSTFSEPVMTKKL